MKDINVPELIRQIYKKQGNEIYQRFYGIQTFKNGKIESVSPFIVQFEEGNLFNLTFILL